MRPMENVVMAEVWCKECDYGIGLVLWMSFSSNQSYFSDLPREGFHEGVENNGVPCKTAGARNSNVDNIVLPEWNVHLCWDSLYFFRKSYILTSPERAFMRGWKIMVLYVKPSARAFRIWKTLYFLSNMSILGKATFWPPQRGLSWGGGKSWFCM